mgnify:FL=1
MKRSLRRHHRERLLSKMIRDDYYGLSYSVREEKTFTEQDRRKNYRLSCDHRKMCSCWMCGNPRRQKLGRKDRLTFQELKADERDDSF